MIVKINARKANEVNNNGVIIRSDTTYTLGVTHDELSHLVDALSHYRYQFEFRHGNKGKSDSLLNDLKIATQP